MIFAMTFAVVINWGISKREMSEQQRERFGWWRCRMAIRIFPEAAFGMQKEDEIGLDLSDRSP
jgi:hypothetical protein